VVVIKEEMNIITKKKYKTCNKKCTGAEKREKCKK
jgi:hypothetical protein